MRDKNLRTSRRAQQAVVGLSVVGALGVAAAVGTAQASNAAAGTGDDSSHRTKAHQRLTFNPPSHKLTQRSTGGATTQPRSTPTKQAAPPPPPAGGGGGGTTTSSGS